MLCSLRRLVGRLGSMSRMDSMDSVLEMPSPSKAEVTDPGHVLRKFSCATGGDVVEADGGLVKRFEFAIETSVGPSIFHRTKVRPSLHPLSVADTGGQGASFVQASAATASC